MNRLWLVLFFLILIAVPAKNQELKDDYTKQGVINTKLFHGQWLVKRIRFEKNNVFDISCITEYFYARKINGNTEILPDRREESRSCDLIKKIFGEETVVKVTAIMVARVDKNIAEKLKTPGFQVPDSHVVVKGYRYHKPDEGFITDSNGNIARELAYDLKKIKPIEDILEKPPQ